MTNLQKEMDKCNPENDDFKNHSRIRNAFTANITEAGEEKSIQVFKINL